MALAWADSILATTKILNTFEITGLLDTDVFHLFFVS